MSQVLAALKLETPAVHRPVGFRREQALSIAFANVNDPVGGIKD